MEGRSKHAIDEGRRPAGGLTVLQGAKLVLGLLLLGAFVYLDRERFLALPLSADGLGAWATGYLLVFLGYYPAVQRWRLLLRCVGSRCSTALCTRLTLIAVLFNLATPGGVAGEAARLWYLKRYHGLAWGPVAATLAADRVLALLALVLIGGTTGALAGLPDASGTLAVAFRIGAWLAVVSLPALALALALSKRLPALDSLVAPFRRSWPQVAASLLMSLLSQGLTIGGLVLLLRALGGPAVSGFTLVALVSAGVILSAIPLLPASIGTGHLAFSFLLAQAGVEGGSVLYSLYLLHFIPVMLLGTLANATYRGDARAAGEAPAPEP